MQLIGFMSILYGVILIFSIWGILICWLPIWIGVLLFKAGSLIEIAHASGDSVKYLEALTKIKAYFTITGVLTLIGLVVGGIAILMTGGAIFTMFHLF